MGDSRSESSARARGVNPAEWSLRSRQIRKISDTLLMSIDPETLMNGMNWSVQLIGLLSAWKQDRKSAEDDKFQSFLIWLGNHNFTALKERIYESEELQRDLHEILKEDLTSISNKLDIIAGAVSAVSSHIQGFEKLFPQVNPKQKALSNQACLILAQFSASGSDTLIYRHFMTMEGKQHHSFSPQLSGMLETRFIRDDLDSLEYFGLITLVGLIGEHKSPKYTLTREGVKFLNSLKNSPGSKAAQG